METITSVYEEIGVKPVINATGHRTVLGGSTPSPRVKAAMEAAERHYVDMAELHAKAGETIARLVGAEAAYVTSGAAAALAACITGKDQDKIARLPHTAGLKHRVVIQKAQRYHYDHVVTMVGTTLLEVGDDQGTSANELEAALGPDVACVLYPAHLEGAPGTLTLPEVVAIAHAKGVPVLVDAAGQVYPIERFKSYPKTGADLICYGAKYIGSVHSSGFLCGRQDLVEAASMNGFIGYETVSGGHAFGRPMKLDRQEIVAVVVAVQEWLTMDHDQRVLGLERRIEAVSRRLRRAPGVRLEVISQDGASPRVLRIHVDPSTARASAESVAQKLKDGNPMVYVHNHEGSIIVIPSTLSDDDAEVVGQRLAEILGPA